jgi:hypothetical protein
MHDVPKINSQEKFEDLVVVGRKQVRQRLWKVRL